MFRTPIHLHWRHGCSFVISAVSFECDQGTSGSKALTIKSFPSKICGDQGKGYGTGVLASALALLSIVYDSTEGAPTVAVSRELGILFRDFFARRGFSGISGEKMAYTGAFEGETPSDSDGDESFESELNGDSIAGEER